MNIIITGATKGIGRAAASLFAAKGFDICVCARTQKDLEKLKDELLSINNNIKVFIKKSDVSIKKDVLSFSDFCLSHFPSPDILMNNAGIFLPGSICEEPEGTLEQLIDTNLYSAYHLTRNIVPAMKKNKKGHIFNLCSVASINSYDTGGSYAISKFALYGFSKNLRRELQQFNIRVTAVLPGAVLTDSWAGTTLPESRFIVADDVAQLMYNAWEISERSVVEEILIRPMLGDI